jgi:hypothetical protein
MPPVDEPVDWPLWKVTEGPFLTVCELIDAEIHGGWSSAFWFLTRDDLPEPNISAVDPAIGELLKAAWSH